MRATVDPPARPPRTLHNIHYANYRKASCEDSIGCMHGSSEPDLRNWKSPPPQFTQGARPDEHP
ncbi:hypothetical protein CX042_09925 [Bordetella pertussis]|nr:hypothetical protein WU05_09690 [Bordetella pertussis]PNO97666.1 hypothetical protein AL465_001030 [Bordetella pertussis 18323]AQC39247.1 hypothetical protein WU39_09940 [Bordetella pertussis]ASR58746.1 hypothetical protein CBO47_09920 [Bordetella pertussis]ASR62116.1 hypothetical protein CBO46_08250 [Bordetella pertussis]